MKKYKNLPLIMFFVLLTILVLFVFLFFLFGLNNEKEEEMISLEKNYIFDSLEEYTIEERAENFVVINKKSHLFFTVPNTWKIEKESILIDKGIEEKFLVITSPEHIHPEEGCKMHFAIYSEEGYYNHLQEKISNTLASNNDNLIEVDGAFGVLFETENKIIMRALKRNKIYELGVHFFESNKECKEAYYNLIDTINLDYD